MIYNYQMLQIMHRPFYFLIEKKGCSGYLVTRQPFGP